MKRVELHFDYASPWAYLASELVSRELAGITVDYRPLYLRGTESFAKGMPYSSAKLAYIMNDLPRCAAHEGIPLAPPAAFPIDGLHALRAALVAQDRGAFERYHGPMFRAVWAESREVSKKEGVAKLLAEALGATEAEALEAMAAQPIKDRLRDATDAAVKRGVFGVPTFFVGDEMFWGHDRLAYVARAAGA
jgi:2-hydroxychromene-2-carboxylate isomerase